MNSNICISAIVAMAKNRVIGDGQSLLWKIPEDFKRVKNKTMGSPLIMGRRTWDSIGEPLPGRANIVLTRNKNWKEEGAIPANTFIEAHDIAKNWIFENQNQGSKKDEIFLFGGSEIYKLGLPFCQYLYLTEVDLNPNSKVFFPLLKSKDWKIIFKGEKKVSKNTNFIFLSYERVLNLKKIN